MKKEKYIDELKSKCKNLTRRERDTIFKYDTISSFLLIASIVTLAGYSWLNYAVIQSWVKLIFLGLTCAFFAIAIFLVFWRFSRRNMERFKARMRYSAKIDATTNVKDVFDSLSEEQKAKCKKELLRDYNACTIFYIVLYIVIAVVMFTFMFQLHFATYTTTQAVQAAPIVSFFMYTGICALVYGMITTPLLMLKHAMLPEDDKVKKYIAKHPKAFNLKKR